MKAASLHFRAVFMSDAWHAWLNETWAVDVSTWNLLLWDRLKPFILQAIGFYDEISTGEPHVLSFHTFKGLVKLESLHVNMDDFEDTDEPNELHEYHDIEFDSGLSGEFL